VECSECKKQIAQGETVWTVNVHRELLGDDSILVLESDRSKVFCEDCAESRDFSRLTVPLKSE